jgi:hypothetical protein
LLKILRAIFPSICKEAFIATYQSISNCQRVVGFTGAKKPDLWDEIKDGVAPRFINALSEFNTKSLGKICDSESPNFLPVCQRVSQDMESSTWGHNTAWNKFIRILQKREQTLQSFVNKALLSNGTWCLAEGPTEVKL